MALSSDQALNTSSDLSGSPGDVRAANQRYQGVLSEESRAMEPAMKKAESISAQPMPQPPEPSKAPPAPDFRDFEKDSSGWINAISALAALAGSHGRARGTGALQAFAAGVSGLRQGNQQAFQNAYTTWKANSDAMMRENQQELEKYRAIMENRQLSESEAYQQMKMIGFEYGNKVMAAAENAHQAFAVYDSIVKARVSAEAFMQKLEAKAQMQIKVQEEQQAEQDKQYAQWKDTDFGKWMADQVAMGVPRSQIASWGKNGQQLWEFALRAAQEKDPTLDLGAAEAQYKAFMSSNTQLAKQNVMIGFASNNLEYSLPSLMEITNKYGLGSSTDLNAAYNFIMTHASNQDKANFSTQLRAVTTDYAAFISRGRTQTTVHADNEALKILNDNMGPTSLAGFSQAVAAERDNTMRAMNDTIAKLSKTHGGQSVAIPPSEESSSNSPAGVDAETWRYMTPQEKALWH